MLERKQEEQRQRLAKRPRKQQWREGERQVWVRERRAWGRRRAESETGQQRRSGSLGWGERQPETD